MNYDEHMMAGILTYPFAVLVVYFIKICLTLPIELSIPAMAWGYAFYVLGSDLPDMDHTYSVIHRGIKPIVSVAMGIYVFVNLPYQYLKTPYMWANLSIGWGTAAITAFITWHVFSKFMPRHRGMVHTTLFAGIYGFLAFSVAGQCLNLAFYEALFIGAASFMGYMLHLVLDGRNGSRINF